MEVEIEPVILQEEVLWTLSQLPNNKAHSVDTIPAKLLRPVPPTNIIEMFQKMCVCGGGTMATELETIRVHFIMK